MMHHILVATHGKPTADGALRVACEIAARDEATLGVLAVLPPLPTYDRLRGPALVRHPELERACEEDLLERVRAQIARTANVAARWKVTLAHGRLAHTIVEHAGLTEADLVVLGIGAYAPADRVFGGELALEVARWCSVPVLAVASGSTGLPRHAVAATDFSRSSLDAARMALELLDPAGRLTLLHVCPDVELPREALSEWRTHYRRIADRLLARAARDIGGDESLHIEQRQLEGDPAREIIAFADRAGADLVATGSHGYHVVERILVGSVATRLLRASHCSVLLAPSSATEVEREIAWRAEHLTSSAVM
jgi:nucleotide-binding universal stress UspA family protein